jgi:NTP pyrophosphatase (non-canonical NTP hydrolase)
VSDKLDRAFMAQREFMDMLVEHDRFPEYPVDLTTKPGQRFVKECTFNCIAELMEATVELKNKVHRLSEATEVDLNHYREELGDAFAFFLELCIISNMTAEDLYEEFRRKNALVRRRLQEGY